MISRGYDGEVRAEPLIRLGTTDRVLLGSSLGFLVILVVFANLVWG
jgi:hypothetical protein